jgi:thiamine-monophosphate kinase
MGAGWSCSNVAGFVGPFTMKLSRLGEFGLIERIRRAIPARRTVRIGIGDDAAWVDHPTGSSLITADLLIEGIHFELKWTSLDALGHKSLAVNLSDIAAMGGVPAYAVVSLGIPAHFTSEQIDEFYRGFNRLANKYCVTLVGGDTNLAESFVISVCVIGHPPVRPVRRTGANVGDDIYATGTLGDAALALGILRQKIPRPKRKVMAKLLRRHHQPTPRLTTGALLARQQLATAMIDISDGLLQDLGHICTASGIGAVIWNQRLPRSRAYLAAAGSDNTREALSGGEDYELLFCARPRHRDRIEKLSTQGEVQITRIGMCVAAKQKITVLDASGQPVLLRVEGHDHFKRH